MKGFINYLEKEFFVVVGIILLLVAIIDFTNLDSLIYKNLCVFSYGLGLKYLKCTDYYDIPIWQVFIATGSLLTAYFAYSAVKFLKKKS